MTLSSENPRQIPTLAAKVGKPRSEIGLNELVESVRWFLLHLHPTPPFGWWCRNDVRERLGDACTRAVLALGAAERERAEAMERAAAAAAEKPVAPVVADPPAGLGRLLRAVEAVIGHGWYTRNQGDNGAYCMDEVLMDELVVAQRELGLKPAGEAPAVSVGVDLAGPEPTFSVAGRATSVEPVPERSRSFPDVPDCSRINQLPADDILNAMGLESWKITMANRVRRLIERANQQ